MANKIVKNDEVSKVCGIVMPISPLDGCDEQHWIDVQEILSDSIRDADFEANLVSNAEDVGIIQKRIIQNLYENPVIVCDVSGKNPNVMFELGIRLAFDKPAIIVKDDKTNYSFDTAQIEHLEYPRDLRFGKIVDFKAKLSEKIKKTYDKSVSDPSYTTFLKHFGEFKVAKIDQKEVPGQEFVLDELESIRSLLYRLERNAFRMRNTSQELKSDVPRDFNLSICLKRFSEYNKILQSIVNKVEALDGVEGVRLVGPASHRHLSVTLVGNLFRNEVRDKIKEILAGIKIAPVRSVTKKTIATKKS